MFGFVDETQENIVDLFSYEGAQSQEFTVDTMEHSFKKVTFARIFRVEELQQLQKHDLKLVSSLDRTDRGQQTHLKNKFLVNHFLPNGRLEVGRFQEAQKHFVH